ncbi:hypothetical protein [Methylobacterium sp. A54F]
MRSTFCIAEDRASFEIAVKILVCSLDEHCPGTDVNIFVPNPSPAFRDWLAPYGQVRLLSGQILPADTRYDVKPHAITALFGMGYDEVIWLDSDLIVYRDIRGFFAGAGPETVHVAEEALCHNHSDAGARRARGWGFPVGRCFPFTLNTAILRVTRQHAPLVDFWMSLLQTEAYRTAQSKPWDHRPCHLFGDQDVLSAVLASRDHAHHPVALIRRKFHIVQYFGPYGYTVAERIHQLTHGGPYFIHAQGHRPWLTGGRGRAGSAYAAFSQLYYDISPYILAARRYAGRVGNPAWLARPGWVMRAMSLLGARTVTLTGMPLAASADLMRVANLALYYLGVKKYKLE